MIIYPSGYPIGDHPTLGSTHGAVGAFLADPVINRILTAPTMDLHIREIMGRGQDLLVNLAKGRIGEGRLVASWLPAGHNHCPCSIQRRIRLPCRIYSRN